MTRIPSPRGILLLSLLCLGLVSACQDRKTERTLSPVAKIFWHEQSHYTVYVAQGTALGAHTFANWCHHVPAPSIFRDVVPPAPMWVRYIEEHSWSCTRDQTYLTEIHLRTEHEISGAAWDHGKFGKGMTHEVE